MDRLPSNIIFDIFSRIPVKSLALMRCVSKLWCDYINDPYLGIIHSKRSAAEEPTLMMFHPNPATLNLCFHTIIESVTDTTTLKPNKLPYMEFACKKSLSTYLTRVKHRGSCNGLLYISQDDSQFVTNMSVIDPIKKQCYELPPLPIGLHAYLMNDSCGLGFDASANTYKMVCVLLKTNDFTISDFDKNLCTMVHVFGTDSWHEIPQVPPCLVRGEAVFAQGCLYWLVSLQQKIEGCAKQVIWFDVTKEEFGSISSPPKTTTGKPTRRVCIWHDQLVDLNGQVGYVCNRTLEIWVLKQKECEWVLYCRIDEDGLPELDMYEPVKLLGCRNKDGDIVIKVSINRSDRYYVYILKSGVMEQVDILGRKGNYQGTGIVMMYPNSLLTINGINTNCKSVWKRLFRVKKSCPRY